MRTTEERHMQLNITREQAEFLSRLLEGRLSDWHWDSRSRPSNPDDREHAATLKRKLDDGLNAERW